jgi:hypothetical protein
MMLLPFRADELYGLADIHGQEVIPPQFAFANHSAEGLVVASSVDHDLIIIDLPTLKMRMCREWHADDFAFHQGLLGVRNRLAEFSPVGYVDRTGEFVIQPRFASASSFDRTGATVTINRDDIAERRIDRNGAVMGRSFLQILRFHPEGSYCGARVRWGDYGMVIIDGSGRQITERQFDAVWQEHEGLIPVVFESGWVGWVDVNGEDVHRLRADGVGYHFESGLIPVEEEDGPWGLMNAEGQWVVEPEFDVIQSVGQNRFMIGHRNDRDYISVRLADGEGNLLGDEVFGSIDRFSEGVAQVWRIKEYHDDTDDELEFNFINYDGQLLLPRWS